MTIKDEPDVDQSWLMPGGLALLKNIAMLPILALILLLHGLIHLLGFIRSFELANIPTLTAAIPKPLGMLWLAVTLLFTGAAWLVYTGREDWQLQVLFTVVLSQVVIFSDWEDAWFGTVPNVVILLATLFYL